MIEEAVCRCCGAQLPDRGFYCPSCGKPARCNSCNGILEPGARACIWCGAAVAAGSPAEVARITAPPSPAVNKLSYVETHRGREVRADLTDEAMGYLSETLGALIGARAPGARPVGRRQTVIEHDQPALPGIFGDVEVEDTELPTLTEALPAPSGGSDADKLRRILRFDGDRPRLEETRLKATGKRDYAKRLTFLLLYARDQAGENQTLRADLNALLEEAGVLDSNARTWIRTSGDLRVEGDHVSLRVSGREKAKKILAEVLDPNIPNEWEIGTGSRTRVAKSGAGGDGGTEGITKTTRRRSAGRAKKASQWVSAWKALRREVRDHAALQNLSVVDKGIFGLWAIRQVAPEDGKIVSSKRLAAFIYEAFEIKVHARNLERALKADGKGKVMNPEGTKFQIQPTGIEYVEQKAGAILAPASVTSNGTSKS